MAHFLTNEQGRIKKMINDTQENKKPLEEQKNILNHILIIKNLYFELDGKRISATKAAEILNSWEIIRKENIKGGVYYELREPE